MGSKGKTQGDRMLKLPANQLKPQFESGKSIESLHLT
jgi:hypothetical protein